MRKLLSLGAKPDPRNKQGLTPLIMAAARGCGSAVSYLVEAGADPGLVLSGGATVLHMSADMGLTEVGIGCTVSCGGSGRAEVCMFFIGRERPPTGYLPTSQSIR